MSTNASIPDLVVLTPCIDHATFVEKILTRGQQSNCIRVLRHKVIRDELRDCLYHSPQRLLQPFLRHPCRYLIVWDHDGSGARLPEEAEQSVRRSLEPWSLADRMLAVAVAPELEGILTAQYPKCRELLVEMAKRTNKPVPTDEQILRKTCEILRKDHRRRREPQNLSEACEDTPKELLKATATLTLGRYSPVVVATLAEKLSLEFLKTNRSDFSRITSWLKIQFPPSSLWMNVHDHG